jgi:hypothetical protein
MRLWFVVGLFVGGALSVTVGAFLAHPAAGFIVTGLLAMGVGLLVDFGEDE